MNTERLNYLIDKYVNEAGFSGVIRVTLKDEIIFERSIGYADIDKKLPFSDSSAFTLYSLSKPFCAIGLMLLCDKGLVDLDSHPSRYLPEAAGFHKDMKIRHMLDHSSGAPDPTLTVEFFEKHRNDVYVDYRELIKELSAYPPFFLPGEDTLYENTNFIVPALIIENVSGKSYADYMRDEVFSPLGMRTAQVDRAGLEIENRVVGYEKDASGKLVKAEKTYYSMFGAGDIVGSADDVYCLNLAIKHKKLLSERMWEEILTPSRQTRVGFGAMGFGCMLSTWHGKKRITHTGGSKGFRTLHHQLPEDDLDIIILSNFGFGDARVQFGEYIYDCVFGKDALPSDELEMDKGYI